MPSLGFIIKSLIKRFILCFCVVRLLQIDSPDTDNVVHEFRWGFRAEQELNKEDVLEVISQVS